MYPHERSLVKRLENKPFVLVGVNSDRDKDVLRKALAKEQITWGSFWDGGSTSGPIATAWNVRGWPTQYVIDADGIIRWGYANEKGIEQLVAAAEAASKKD